MKYKLLMAIATLVLSDSMQGSAPAENNSEKIISLNKRIASTERHLQTTLQYPENKHTIQKMNNLLMKTREMFKDQQPMHIMRKESSIGNHEVAMMLFLQQKQTQIADLKHELYKTKYEEAQAEITKLKENLYRMNPTPPPPYECSSPIVHPYVNTNFKLS